MELLGIVIVFPFVLWLIAMAGIKLSGTRVHRIWKGFQRFIVKMWVFMLPFYLVFSLGSHFFGENAFVTIVSVGLALIVYRKYANTLVENLYLN